MNAWDLAFKDSSFDVVISGFMGWYDCFDFNTNTFTRTDTKSKEIFRVLKDGGRFVFCSWLSQQDLRWMEDAIVRYYPAILEDDEYLERRPIGMAYEKPEGYQIILRNAGFHDINVHLEKCSFISSDEQEWWRQMQSVGWASLLEKIERNHPDQTAGIKAAIFKDLGKFQNKAGILFTKEVFFVSGMK
jgi:ubiquinone/menaquinone biosynthesis C-methylase UbiE